MENSEKQLITRKLAAYVKRFESQKRAANSLRGVSEATVSQIVNGNHEQVSEAMWRNIHKQIDYDYNAWVTVETRNFQAVRDLLHEAKADSMVFSIVGPSGSGKTETIKWFTNNSKLSYHIQCDDFWNKKHFLSEVMRNIGADSTGLTIAEMVTEITRMLRRQHRPLLIIDEIDKLPDTVLFFFISFYNRLEGSCGIVPVGSPYLKKRIERGLNLGKKGYEEIHSRLGGRFIEIGRTGSDDIAQICMANGVTDRKDVGLILNEGATDLRRVKNMIYALKKKQAREQQPSLELV